MKAIFCYLMLVSLLSITAKASNEKICSEPFREICREAMPAHHETLGNLKAITNKVRWDALNRLGYKNWKDFFNKKFKENKLQAPKFSLKKLKVLRSVGGLYLSAEEMVPQISQCEKRVDQLFKGIGAEPPLGAYRKRYGELLQLLTNTRNETLRMAMSQGHHSIEVFNDIMDDECDLKDMKPTNREICRSIKGMKKRFLMNQRNEGLDQSFFDEVKRKSDSLVTYSKKDSFSSYKKMLKGALKYSDMEELKALYSTSYAAKNFCSTPGADEAISVSIKAVFKDYLQKVFSSKEVISEIMQAIYTDEIKQILDSDFEVIKNDLMSVVSTWGIDDAVKVQIGDSFSQLKLNWPEMPEDSQFTKDEETGLLVLDESKLTEFDFIMQTFIDSELSILSTVNAFYMPHFSYGKISLKTQVNILPYFIELYKVNPDGVRFVMAHEAGHNIDYNLARVNGFDGLQDFYKELITCYSGHESFNMTFEQSGEALADFLASEVMAKRMNKPNGVNIKLVNESLMPFCAFDEFGGDLDVESTHPEPFFRISAISMANPSVREKLMCKAPQKHFKSCGLR